MNSSVVRRVLSRGCRSMASRGAAVNVRSSSQTPSSPTLRFAAVNVAPSSSRAFQTSIRRLQSSDACDVHAAETQNAAASDYLGVVYNATKTKKYSAELKLQDGRVIEGGDYWTAECAAKGYDSLVAKYGSQDAPRNFEAESGEAA